MNATHSDYVIYVDESGDHSLTSIDPQFPIFSLAFFIVRKSDYVHEIVPRFQELKFKWFGHDMVVFHEAEIRRRAAPFVFLGDPEKREEFMRDISQLMTGIAYSIVACVINKSLLSNKYSSPDNPYALALLFCLERAAGYLNAHDQDGKITHIICESRGKKEDVDLELEFLRITSGRHFLRSSPIDGFRLIFADKKCNSTGLQVADLIARPIGLNVLRPEQPNAAFDLIRSKIWDRKRFP